MTQNPHPLGLTAEEVALSYTTKDAPLVRYGAQNSDGVPMDKFSRLTGDDAEEFSFYSDGDECVITQHRYYRWGDIVLAVGEINEPNTWDDAYFDAKCAELETIFARITELEAHIAAEHERMREVAERCAKVAEEHGNKHDTDSHAESGRQIAAAIRAQGTIHESG